MRTYFCSFLIQDRDGNPRVTGEEWLVKKTGAYLPGAYEEVIDTVGAYVLSDKASDENPHVTPRVSPAIFPNDLKISRIFHKYLQLSTTIPKCISPT